VWELLLLLACPAAAAAVVQVQASCLKAAAAVWWAVLQQRVAAAAVLLQPRSWLVLALTLLHCLQKCQLTLVESRLKQRCLLRELRSSA
jgi:hypothetical protein